MCKNDNIPVVRVPAAFLILGSLPTPFNPRRQTPLDADHPTPLQNLSPRRQRNTCENITVPQTSFAGGNCFSKVPYIL